MAHNNQHRPASTLAASSAADPGRRFGETAQAVEERRALPTPTETAAIAAGTPTAPGVISSDDARDFKAEAETRITSARERSVVRQEKLDRDRERRRSEIERQSERGIRERRATQEQTRATQDVLQFRLGQTGTRFEAEQDVQLRDKQDQVIADLEAQKQSLLNAADIAFEENDFTRLNALQAEISKIEKESGDAEKEFRSQQLAESRFLLDLQKERRAGATAQAGIQRGEEASARAETQLAITEAKFLRENEDRIAEALGSQLIGLDENNNIIRPSNEDIRAFAEQNGISANILNGQVNARIDDIRKVQRDNRKDALSELKFDETLRQNEIRNQLEQRRVAISGGNLAQRQREFEQKQLDQGKFAFNDNDTRRLIGAGLAVDDVSNIQDRLNAGENIDQIFADSEVSEEQEQKLRNVLEGITPTQEAREDREDKPAFTVSQTAAANDRLVKNAEAGTGTFGTQLQVEDTSIEDLANLASKQGADLNGFVSGLRASGNFNFIDTNIEGLQEIEDNRGFNKTIGFINTRTNQVFNTKPGANQ